MMEQFWMSNSQTFLSLLLMDLIESCLKRIYCNHILVIFFVTHLLLLVMMAMLYYYSGEKRPEGASEQAEAVMQRPRMRIRSLPGYKSFEHFAVCSSTASCVRRRTSFARSWRLTFGCGSRLIRMICLGVYVYIICVCVCVCV